MIKIGEVYFDTVLETLFIVDAIGGSRVYLLELKERIDPRVVIEKPETIFKRYKLTNIGFQSESRIGYPHPGVNSMSIEHLADVDNNAKPLTGDMIVGSFGPENKNISPYSTNQPTTAPPSKGSSYVVTPESTFGIRVKDITPRKAAPRKAAPKKAAPKKAAPKKAAPKKVIKKSIQKTNKK